MSLKMQMSVSAGTEADTKKDAEDSQKYYTSNIVPETQKNSSIICKFYGADIFSQLKIMLDITSVLEYYGVSINSKGFASCPFHQENTPSFKVYEDNFYCFGCGASGTAIDFAMKYFGLTNIEAAKKLNEDFKLNLPIGKNAGTAICRPTKENKYIVEKFIKWEKQAFVTISSYFRTLKFWGEQIFINHIEYFEQYLPDVENIVFVEILVYMMIENMHDFPAQVEFYKTFGKAVVDIERKINA